MKKKKEIIQFCWVFYCNQIDGYTTLNENIADAGGIRQAFHAYKNYTNEYGKEQYLQDLGDYSHEQLFFLSFANVRVYPTIGPTMDDYLH